jgi:hypothetical protein
MENSCLLSSCMVSINYLKSPSLHLPKNQYLPTFRELVQPKLMRDQPLNCRMVLNVTIIDQTINLPSSAFFTTSHVGSEFWLLPPYSTSWWLINCEQALVQEEVLSIPWLHAESLKRRDGRLKRSNCLIEPIQSLVSFRNLDP